MPDNQVFALIITHIIALILYHFHVPFWVKMDTARITADGSAQTLAATFHRQRTTWRFAFVVVVALLASTPLLGRGEEGEGWNFVVGAAGLAILGGGYFFYAFTPALNLARGLAYVSKWHVSWAVNASFLDRFIWAQAWRKARLPGWDSTPPAYPEPITVALAGQLLRRYLLLGLLASVGVYAASLLFLFL